MRKKVIKIEDTGCDKTYYPISYTHDNYDNGGRKIDILNEEAGKCLCGFEPFLYNAVFYEEQFGHIVAYIAQPDPGKCLCQKCKQILINSLEV